MTTTSAADPRRIEYMPLADVVPAARNPKEHDGAGIRRSIDRFGVAEVVLLDERTGRLVAGHGRIEALAEMERDETIDTPPDGVVLGEDGAWTVPVVRGWSSRSDAEAEAYLVASNRLAERGGADERALAELLEELADQQLLDVTGYEQADLDALLDSVGGQLDDLPGELEPEQQGNEGESQQGHLLTVDKTKIHLTEEEFAYWRRAYKDYMGRTGTDFGFVLSVLRGDAQHLRDAYV